MNAMPADVQQVVAAQHGSRPTQATLLRQFQDPWYRLCLSLLRDPDAARDATQETAMRFLRDLPTFRGQSQLLTWSMGIAINIVREMRRNQRPPLAFPQPSAGFDPPDRAAADAEESEALHLALAELSDRQREAIVLRFFEGMSVEQSAVAMDCAAGTVKATVHQALRALRGKLTSLT
jgi:RNA polymerase sigma-70 factor (ECF subfamily)